MRRVRYRTPDGQEDAITYDRLPYQDPVDAYTAEFLDFLKHGPESRPRILFKKDRVSAAVSEERGRFDRQLLIFTIDFPNVLPQLAIHAKDVSKYFTQHLEVTPEAIFSTKTLRGQSRLAEASQER